MQNHKKKKQGIWSRIFHKSKKVKTRDEKNYNNIEIDSKSLVENKEFSKEFHKKKQMDLSKLKDKYTFEFENYLDIIKPLGKDFDNIGAIVDDFDPFTLEHRYLIEKALEQVDFLYLFIKDYDQGFLPIEDRFQLLQLEVKDLKHITILSCGGFVF